MLYMNCACSQKLNFVFVYDRHVWKYDTQVQNYMRKCHKDIKHKRALSDRSFTITDTFLKVLQVYKKMRILFLTFYGKNCSL